MLTQILRQLVTSILKRVSEGFAAMADSLGELNDKITVVENEYTTKFKRFDALDAKVTEFTDGFAGLPETEVDMVIDAIVTSEASKITL